MKSVKASVIHKAIDGRHSETSQDFTLTHSRCSDCLEMLPKEDFTPDSKKDSGVANRCGKCLSIYRKKRAEELGKIYQGVRPDHLKVKKDKTFYNDTHAECSVKRCGIHPKENFWPKKDSKRGVVSMCKEHANIYASIYNANRSDESKKKDKIKRSKKRAKNIIKTTYQSYKRKRRDQSRKDRFDEPPEVDMTYEEFVEIWPKDGKCPHFHNKLIITPLKGRTDSTPSIDRKDSDKPYSKDNIEIVSWRYNHCKSDTTVEERFAMGGAAAKELGFKWPPEKA
jgi:hypothetical protein